MTQETSSQLPSRDSPIVSSGGLLDTVWYNFMVFLASLVAKAPEQVTVGTSPYDYEASSIGHLHVAAGIVSSVVLQRGGITLSCPTSNSFVPVVSGDVVTITYTAAPTVYFLPGART